MMRTKSVVTILAVGALMMWAAPASAQTPPGCFGTGVGLFLSPSNLPGLEHGDTINYAIIIQPGGAPTCNMIDSDVFFLPPNIAPDAANACDSSGGILVATVPLLAQGGASVLITGPGHPSAGIADFTHPALDYVVAHADEDAAGVVTAFACVRGDQLTSPSQVTTASTSIPNTVSHACCLPDGGCVTVTNAECVAQGGSPQPLEECDGVEACCLPDGTCADMDPLCCELQGGTPEGPGTVCSPAPEACCLPDGTCVELDPLCCEDIGGTPEGPGTQCTAPEACCLPDGTCVEMDPLCCADLGGTPGGPGSQCTAEEACCLPDGTCIVTDPVCCALAGGTPEGPGTQCTAPEACCLPDGTCVELDPLCCADIGGTPEGPGTQCTATEACCLPDGTCVEMDPLCCADLGGVPGGPGSQCTSEEACCLPDGTCITTDPACCILAGGTPEGPDTVCTETEACCLPDGTCVEMDPLCCEDLGGVPQGPGVTCDSDPCDEGGEGCTPGFWKNHPDCWACYSPATLVGDVFDVPGALSDLADDTLIQAISYNGGGGVIGAARNLLRAAAASLQNACNTDVDFSLSEAEVIAAVNAALASLDRATILELATELDIENNSGCPIDAHCNPHDED